MVHCAVHVIGIGNVEGDQLCSMESRRWLWISCNCSEVKDYYLVVHKENHDSLHKLGFFLQLICYFTRIYIVYNVLEGHISV